MRTRCLCTVLLLSVACSPVLAQSDAPASREDVTKLFNVMHLHDQMRLVTESMLKQQRAMVHENMKKRFPQTTDQEFARMDQFLADTMKDLPVDGMLEDMIPVYQKHLTKSDVDAMSTFYASATGQKILREMPAMTSESMQAAGPRLQSMMDKLMDRAEQMAKEDRDKKSTAPKPATDKN